jgi:hypothetical protein
MLLFAFLNVERQVLLESRPRIQCTGAVMGFAEMLHLASPVGFALLPHSFIGDGEMTHFHERSHMIAQLVSILV